MTAEDRRRKQEADRLYEQYGKPLEREHLGEYVAITPEGKVVFGSTLLEAIERARAELGPDNLVLKLGQGTVGKWR